MTWFAAHPILSVVIAIAISAILIINLIAYRHARTMVTYSRSGSKTPAPERLSLPAKLRVLFSGITVLRPAGGSSPAAMGLEFTTHDLEANGVRIEAWHIPHPNPRGTVILFHGYAACKDQRLPEAKEFYDLGFSAVLVDFRGSGGSDLNRTSIGYYEADEVMATIDFARTVSQDKPIVLFGLSMGGAAILRAIAHKGLQPDLIIIEGVFDGMLSTVKNRFDTMGLPSFPGAHLLTFWGGFQQGFQAFRHNPIDYARQVTCPTLMLHGIHDPRATIDEAERLFACLAGPKHLERFDAGHESCLSVASDQWRTAVVAFLDEHLET